MSKVYYVIVREVGGSKNFFVASTIAIVEDEEIAIDFCAKNSGCKYYKEEVKEND